MSFVYDEDDYTCEVDVDDDNDDDLLRESEWLKKHHLVLFY